MVTKPALTQYFKAFMFCSCAFCYFDIQTLLSQTAERRPAKVIRRLVLRPIRKIHSVDISPTPPRNFTGIKSVEKQAREKLIGSLVTQRCISRFR